MEYTVIDNIDFMGNPIKPRSCRKCKIIYHAIRFSKDSQHCGKCSYARDHKGSIELFKEEI